MNTGMQDAFNLAWKLAMVIHGTAGDTLLDSYSPERSHVGDQVLKSAGALTAVGTLRNAWARGVRDTIGHLLLGFGSVQRAFAANMTEVSVDYPKSPLNGPSVRGLKQQPGERIAPMPGQLPIGAGSTPRFALLGDATAAISEMLGRYGGVLDPVAHPSRGEGFLTLVRPDGYIAGIFKNETALEVYLKRITGG